MFNFPILKKFSRFHLPKNPISGIIRHYLVFTNKPILVVGRRYVNNQLLNCPPSVLP